MTFYSPNGCLSPTSVQSNQEPESSAAQQDLELYGAGMISQDSGPHTSQQRQMQVDASVPFGKQVAKFQHSGSAAQQQPRSPSHNQEATMQAAYNKFNSVAAQEM